MAPSEKTDDSIEAVADALRDLYVRSHRIVDRRMRGEGLSLARMKVLGFIAERGSVRSADIAAEFGHSPRTVTEAIDGLERDGLIRRAPHATDRRAKQLTATPAGEATLAACRPIRAGFMADVFGTISEADRAELGRILAAINARLAELED